MDYYIYLLYSLIINCVLLFCLFSPNIVYFIHKRWFEWKKQDLKKELFELENELDIPFNLRYYNKFKD